MYKKNQIFTNNHACFFIQKCFRRCISLVIYCFLFLYCCSNSYAQKFKEEYKKGTTFENAGKHYEAFDMYRNAMLCSDAPKINDAEMRARACYNLFREQEKKTDKKTAYDYFFKVSNSRGVAIRNKLYYMTDTSCNLICDKPFENITYVGYNVFVFLQEKMFGLINSDGKVLMQPECNNVKMYNNGILRMYKSNVELKNGENVDVMYEYNTRRKEFFNLHIATKHSKDGLINSNKEFVIAPQYSSLNWAGLNYWLIANKDNKCLLIDTTGKVIFSVVGEIKPYNGQFFRYSITNKKNNSKEGVLSSSGEILIPAKYKTIFSPKDGIFKVEYPNEKYGLINSYGKVIAKGYDKISDFSKGVAKVEKNEKCGFIDKNGQIIYPLKYEDVTWFSDSLCIIKDGLKYGLYDKKGKKVLPTEYQRIDTLHNGYAIFKKDGRYGYFNERGQIALPAEYTDASPFYQGLAAVKYRGKWIYINTDGKQAFEGKYKKADPFYYNHAVVKTNNGFGVIDNNGNFKVEAIYPKIDIYKDSLIVAIDSTGEAKCFDFMGKRRYGIVLYNNKPYPKVKRSKLIHDLIDEKFIAGYLKDTLFSLGNHLVTYDEFVNTIVNKMTTWTDSLTFYNVLQYAACEEHNRVRLIFTELSRQSREVSLDNWLFSFIGYKEFDDYPLTLILNKNLVQAAQEHSVNMANSNFFSHEDPQGRQHYNRIAEKGHKFSMSGENIQKGVSS